MTASHELPRFATPRGDSIVALGPTEFLTLGRMERITRRFDADPRIATISLAAGPVEATRRASAPGGVIVCIRLNHEELVGQLDPDGLESWSRDASNRGLAHEWWITPAPDIAAAVARADSKLDIAEASSPTSNSYHSMGRTTSEISIAVDASWLGEHETGAQVLTTAAVAALANHSNVSRIQLRGITELPVYAEHLADHAKISIVDTDQADVCWFPNQIDFRSNLASARSWGRRVVTTYLDLIAYDIPRYHASPDAWQSYRSLQRTTALASDGITTISADVAARLQEEVPLLDPQRVRAIPLGLDHIAGHVVSTETPEEVRELQSSLQSRPFVLVLGNDFLHKNRDFAIKVWRDVLQSDLVCDLVLTGLHVRGSSSRNEEEAALSGHVDLRGRIHTLGHVSSEARSWLLTNASAILYPSSAEGFGFVPYEAAALGTPSTFTLFGPLSELTGVSDAPRSWSRQQYADDLAGLLASPEAAQSRVQTLREAVSLRTWDHYANELVAFMQEIIAQPVSPAGAVLTEVSVNSTELNALLASKTWRLTAPLRRVGKAFRSRDHD